MDNAYMHLFYQYYIVFATCITLTIKWMFMASEQLNYVSLIDSNLKLSLFKASIGWDNCMVHFIQAGGLSSEVTFSTYNYVCSYRAWPHTLNLAAKFSDVNI